MIDNNLIKSIYQAKQQKAEIEAKISDLKAEVVQIDNYIEEQSNALLNQMKSDSMKEAVADDIVAISCQKSTVGYTSEQDVLQYLKNNGYEKYIRTKVTESLDKVPLKKAIKNDETLAKALEDMTVENVTEWVVVTTEENRQKMLEAMEQK